MKTILLFMLLGILNVSAVCSEEPVKEKLIYVEKSSGIWVFPDTHIYKGSFAPQTITTRSYWSEEHWMQLHKLANVRES